MKLIQGPTANKYWIFQTKAPFPGVLVVPFYKTCWKLGGHMFQVAKLGLFWLQKLSQWLEKMNQNCDVLRPSQANQRWDGGKSRTFWMGLKTEWSHPLWPQIRGVWQDWDNIPLSFTTYPIALLPTSSEYVVSIPYPRIKQPQAQKSS